MGNFILSILIASAPVAAVAAILRISLEHTMQKWPEVRFVPLWVLAVGVLLTSASLACLGTALERSDYLDYPDDGQVGSWFGVGMCLLVAGTGVSLYGLCFSSAKVESDDAPAFDEPLSAPRFDWDDEH